MMSIHLIERTANFDRVPGSTDEWATGKWKISPNTAASLPEGRLYLHIKTQAQSYFGGNVTSVERHECGRYTIRFRFETSAVNNLSEGYRDRSLATGVLFYY